MQERYESAARELGDKIIGLIVHLTILHPQDRYSAELISVSPSGHVVRVRSACGTKLFTWRKGDGVGQFVEAGKSSPALAIGFAEDHRAPEV